MLERYELAERIAKSHNVRPDQVVLGAGSTEILRMASCAFLGPGKQLVQASPTYPAIEFYARANGAEVISDPLNRRFGHDLDAMLAHAGPSAGLVYICNPNNPDRLDHAAGGTWRISSPGCLPPVTS